MLPSLELVGKPFRSSSTETVTPSGKESPLWCFVAAEIRSRVQSDETLEMTAWLVLVGVIRSVALGASWSVQRGHRPILLHRWLQVPAHTGGWRHGRMVNRIRGAESCTRAKWLLLGKHITT